MKKLTNQTARRPLTLDRETIRQLSSTELGQIAGGVFTYESCGTIGIDCIPPPTKELAQ